MHTPSAQALQREALRQQMLLRALWRDAPDTVVAGWLRGPADRGLKAYRDNAGALAVQALAAPFPTVQQLLGDAAFAGMARAFWRAQPPQAGDLGEWGAALPAFIEAEPALAEEPYLADVARLEWALHQAERAADAQPLQGVERLADTDPQALFVRFQPGVWCGASAHPVVTIWVAHRQQHAERFLPVQAAFAQGRQETAWVWRQGLVGQARALSAAEARFNQHLLAGHSLGAALEAAQPGPDGQGLDFEAWLLNALHEGCLAAFDTADSRTATPQPGPPAWAPTTAGPVWAP